MALVLVVYTSSARGDLIPPIGRVLQMEGHKLPSYGGGLTARGQTGSPVPGSFIYHDTLSLMDLNNVELYHLEKTFWWI
jgi:hypothetical protein